MPFLSNNKKILNFLVPNVTKNYWFFILRCNFFSIRCYKKLLYFFSLKIFSLFRSNKKLFYFSGLGSLHCWRLRCVLWALLWPPHKHSRCRAGPGPKCRPRPGAEVKAVGWDWSLLWQSFYFLPAPEQTVWDGHCRDWYCPAESPPQGAHSYQEGYPEEGCAKGLPGEHLQRRPDSSLLERQQACLCCQQQVHS